MANRSVETFPTSANLCIDFKQIIQSNSEWRKSPKESREEAYWNALLSSPETDVLVSPIFEIQSKRVLFLFTRYRSKIQGFQGNYCGQKPWSDSIDQMGYISELDIQKLRWIMGEDYTNNQQFSDLRIERIVDVSVIDNHSVDVDVEKKLEDNLLQDEVILGINQSVDSSNQKQLEKLDTIQNQIEINDVNFTNSILVKPELVAESNIEFLSSDSLKTNEKLDSKASESLSNNRTSNEVIVVGEQRQSRVSLANEEKKVDIKANKEEEPGEENAPNVINGNENDEAKVTGVDQDISDDLYIYHDFAIASLIKRLDMQGLVDFVDFERLYYFENEFLSVYFSNNSTAKDYNSLDEKLAQLEKQNAKQLIYVMQTILVKLSSKDYSQDGDINKNTLIRNLEIRANEYLKTLPSELKMSIQSDKDLQIFRKQLLTLYRAALCYRRMDQLSAAPASNLEVFDETIKSNQQPTEMVEKTTGEDFPKNLNQSIFKMSADFKYSRRNPIPKNVVMPEGVVFSIQVGAFRKELPNDFYREFGPIRIENVDGQLNRYIAGCFVNESEAQLALGQIRLRGYPDAFMVAYQNGIRIPVHQARNLRN
ncbi:MAG: hypothetical protein RLY35_37 [Bacteroidota bacterium]|jgi:hypothetical protein